MFDYVARSGYDQQLGEEPEDPGRPDNLMQPMPDGGTHGVFTDRAKSHSPAFWANAHRGWIAAGIGVVALAGVLSWMRRRV